MTVIDDNTNSKNPFIGLTCKITLRKGNNTLFYTGTILDINSSGITFKDKLGMTIYAATSEILMMEEIQPNKFFGDTQ